MSNRNNIFQLISRLWAYIDLRRRRQLLFVFILMLASAFFEILTLSASFPFLRSLSDPMAINNYLWIPRLIGVNGILNRSEMIFFLALIFIFSILLTATIRCSLIWAQSRIGFGLTSDLSLKIYERTLYQPYQKHINRNSSEVISAVTSKAGALVGSLVTPSLIILSSLLLTLAIIIFLMFMNPYIALSSFLGFFLLYLVVVGFTRNKLHKNSKLINITSNKVIRVLQEGLGGIRDVILDGSQHIHLKMYKDACFPMNRAYSNLQIISHGPRYIVEAFGMMLVVFLVLIASSSEGGFLDSLPVLGMLILSAQRLLPTLQQSFSSWSSIRGGQAMCIDALGFLDEPLPNQDSTKDIQKLSFKNKLQLKNLCFSYGDNKCSVINNVDLTLFKGEILGIIGRTGSGKSTLIDLVMGLLKPSSGNIIIDDVILDDSVLRGWQLNIAHVPQSIFLADASVVENIAFGEPREGIDLNRVILAAKKARISDVIEALPEGYHTFIGERGVMLSGGQRQRVGIARALYKMADVIIFDEATSALDGTTEAEVIHELVNLDENLTIIMIAHRISTLEKTSRIIEMAGGQIKKIGVYDDFVTQKD